MSSSVITISNPDTIYRNEPGYEYRIMEDNLTDNFANIQYLSYDRGEGRRLFSEARKLSDGLDVLVEDSKKALTQNELNELAEQFNLKYDNGTVRVVIHLAEDDFDFEIGSKATIGNVQFELERKDRELLQALVSVDDLIELANSDNVIAITAPQFPDLYDVTSEGVPIIGADKLHDIGIKGQGITIGILDAGFKGYTALLGTELPSTVITKSFYPGGDITGGGITHGTAVAEIVHDVAPEASLVLVNLLTNLDFLNAVDWMIAQNVDVITTSAGFVNTGPMDGTDLIASKASDARNAGIIFDAAPGNYGDKHHYKQFTPSTYGAESHDFKPGNNVGLLNYPYITAAGAPIIIDLVWDDWGVNPRAPTSNEDYDLYLFRYNYFGSKTWSIVTASTNRQNGNDFPRERIGVYAPANDLYGIFIVNYKTTSHHYLNVFSSLPFDETINVPSMSISTPCVGEKVLCVGATNLNDQIEPFSSQGPTIPNENTGIQLDKPDFTAPDGVSTVTSGPLNFYGTSASAPHVGGAAALYLQMSDMDPGEAENKLIANAVDLGALGWDSIYGHGRVRLDVLQFINLSLKQGWNLVSSPLNFTNITEVFKPIEDDFVSMFAYDAYNERFVEIDPFGYIEEIDLTHAAWIKVSKDVTLSISGKEFENTDVPLVQGWNLIGHPYLEEKNISELFDNTNVYSYNGSWSSHIPNRPFNSLKTLKPGYGYWIKTE